MMDFSSVVTIERHQLEYVSIISWLPEAATPLCEN